MGRPRIHDYARIRDLRNLGLTLDAIQSMTGAGRTTVRRVLYERVLQSEAKNQRRGTCPICGSQTTRSRPAGSLYCTRHKHLRNSPPVPALPHREDAK